MAKNKRNDLPTTDDPVESVAPIKRESVRKLEKNEMPVEYVTIRIPVAKIAFGYETRRCDVTSLSGKQKGMLKRATNGIIAAGGVLENGKRVANPQDAIKKLLEDIDSAFQVVAAAENHGSIEEHSDTD